MPLTRRASNLLNEAQGLRSNRRHLISEMRILLAFLMGDGGIGTYVLHTHSVSLSRLTVFLKKRKQQWTSVAPMSLSVWLIASGYLRAAENEAFTLRHNCIGCEHLFLALLRPEWPNVSVVLDEFNLDRRKLRHDVLTILGHDDG